jgi:hypothetical protein
VLTPSSSRPSVARAGIVKRETYQFVTIPDKASPFRDDNSGELRLALSAGKSHSTLSDSLWVAFGAGFEFSTHSIMTAKENY